MNGLSQKSGSAIQLCNATRMDGRWFGPRDGGRGSAGVDDLVWREAMQKAGGAGNPDRLWPVVAAGFASLVQREAAQVRLAR